jgi:hypothetical protein
MLRVAAHTALALSSAFLIYAMASYGCTEPLAEPTPLAEPFEFDLEESDPAAEPPLPDPAPIADPEHRIEIRRVGTIDLYATCYSMFDGATESRGWYANHWNPLTRPYLPIQEERIQTWHYTVALPPELADYHTKLIQLPGGSYTHAYRFHVPGYNLDALPAPGSHESDTDVFSVINHGYYSVPRDRMKWRGRIDVLFTGSLDAVLRKQRDWKRRKTHGLQIEIWEVQVHAAEGAAK